MPKVNPKLRDFRNFLVLIWHYLKLPAPTRLQIDIASLMQHGADRLCIQCWRGFGKSYISSAFDLWCLYLDNDEQILNTSAAKRRADDTTRFQLGLIKMVPELRHLYPRDDQRQSTVEFDVNGAVQAHAPSVRSLGILSNMLTGSRATKINADDIETRKNSQTALMRDRIDVASRELDGAIIKPEPGCKVRFIGTPQLEQSLYHGLEKRGYTTVIYPARYPPKDMMEIYGDKLAPILREDLRKDPSLHGQPVEPERFSDDVLEQREATYGRLGFLLQFMLVPTLAQEDRYPLKLNDLIVTDLDQDVCPERFVWGGDKEELEIPASTLPCVGFLKDRYRRPAAEVGGFIPWQTSVLAIDPAGKGKSELAWAVAKTVNSQIGVFEVGGTLMGYEEQTLFKLSTIAKRHKVRVVVVEENWGGGMFTTLLRPILQKVYPQCGLEEVSHHGMKELRIVDTLEPIMSNHRLVFDRSALRRDYDGVQQRASDDVVSYMVAYQISRMMREKGCLQFLDRLDALAMACAHLQVLMGQDFEVEMAGRQEEAIDKQLEEFMNDARSGRVTLREGAQEESGSSWISCFEV